MVNKSNISIRFANQGDIEALVQFNLLMARETEAKELNPATLTQGVGTLIANEQNGFYVVAETAEQRVVGSLLVTYEWSDWRNGLFWWIQSVYVDANFRRSGIYRRMYEFVKQRAAEKGGVCGFRLYVEKENSVAQKTYQSLGMKETHYLMYEEVFERR
jgi:ribosomal protein S18 acetylase RimI-like enzyme